MSGDGPPTVTPGAVIAFTVLQNRLYFPVGRLLQVSVELQSSMAMFDRIFNYLDLTHEITDSPTAPPPPPPNHNRRNNPRIRPTNLHPHPQLQCRRHYNHSSPEYHPGRRPTYQPAHQPADYPPRRAIYPPGRRPGHRPANQPGSRPHRPTRPHIRLPPLIPASQTTPAAAVQTDPATAPYTNPQNQPIRRGANQPVRCPIHQPIRRPADRPVRIHRYRRANQSGSPAH